MTGTTGHRRWFERHAVLAAIGGAVVAAWCALLWIGLQQPGVAPAGRVAEQLAATEAEIARLVPALGGLEAALAGDVCTLDRPQGGWPPASVPTPPPATAHHQLREAAVIVIVYESQPASAAPKIVQVGSAFLVAPGTFVTTRSVVADDGRKVFVSNPKIGVRAVQGIRPAIATAGETVEDLVLLTLADPVPAEPLRIAVEPPREIIARLVSNMVNVIRDELPITRFRDGLPHFLPESRVRDVTLRPIRAGAPVYAITGTFTWSDHDRGAAVVDSCGRVIGIGVTASKNVVAGSVPAPDVLGSASLARILARSGVRIETAHAPCAAAAPR